MHSWANSPISGITTQLRSWKGMGKLIHTYVYVPIYVHSIYLPVYAPPSYQPAQFEAKTSSSPPRSTYSNQITNASLRRLILQVSGDQLTIPTLQDSTHLPPTETNASCQHAKGGIHTCLWAFKPDRNNNNRSTDSGGPTFLLCSVSCWLATGPGPQQRMFSSASSSHMLTH